MSPTLTVITISAVLLIARVVMVWISRQRKKDFEVKRVGPPYYFGSTGHHGKKPKK